MLWVGHPSRWKKLDAFSMFQPFYPDFAHEKFQCCNGDIASNISQCCGGKFFWTDSEVLVACTSCFECLVLMLQMFLDVANCESHRPDASARNGRPGASKSIFFWIRRSHTRNTFVPMITRTQPYSYEHLRKIRSANPWDWLTSRRQRARRLLLKE